MWRIPEQNNRISQIKKIGLGRYGWVTYSGINLFDELKQKLHWLRGIGSGEPISHH